MVVVDCPHCGDETDLGDGGPGTYACPHCSREFDFGDNVEVDEPEWVYYVPIFLFFFFFFGIFLLVVLFGGGWCVGNCPGGGGP